jgi:hypothetical protein
VGPQLVAIIKDRQPSSASFYAFLAGAAFLAAGCVLALFARNDRFTRRGA